MLGSVVASALDHVRKAPTAAKLSWAAGLLLMSLLALNSLGYHAVRMCDGPLTASAADDEDDDEEEGGGGVDDADGDADGDYEKAPRVRKGGRAANRDVESATVDDAAMIRMALQSTATTTTAEDHPSGSLAEHVASAVVAGTVMVPTDDAPSSLLSKEERSARRIADAERRLRSTVGGYASLGRASSGGNEAGLAPVRENARPAAAQPAPPRIPGPPSAGGRGGTAVVGAGLLD